MAQFDVHRNPGRRSEEIPYVVVVQSSQFRNYHRSVVVPLVRAGLLGSIHFPAFNPSFVIKGTRVVLHPLEIVSVPVRQLGPKIGSLAESGQRIAEALDELLSRAWK